MKRLKISQPECWLNVILIVLFGVLIALLVSACSPDQAANADTSSSNSDKAAQATETTQSTPSVQVTEAYARAVPPNSPASAVFLTLHNNGEQEQRLVSATSNVANVVELHNHVKQDGMMQMRKIDHISIPAKGKTTLKPGGLHIMLIQLQQPLVVDSTIAVTLHFADGSEQALTVPVREISSMMQQHH
ncbi:MAG TPA: copper chaperone PCu(A)C [Thiothrix sp.]|nr:copper chaperone PCu(A)C [Thiothrix sp.]